MRKRTHNLILINGCCVVGAALAALVLAPRATPVWVLVVTILLALAAINAAFVWSLRTKTVVEPQAPKGDARFQRIVWWILMLGLLLSSIWLRKHGW